MITDVLHELESRTQAIYAKYLTRGADAEVNISDSSSRLVRDMIM